MESTTEAIDLLLDGYPDVPLSRQQINALPYASIGVKIGQGPRSLLVLGRQANNDLHWISADRAVLVTRHGYIVRTVGFGDNLRGTRYTDGKPMMPLVQGRPETTSHVREIDIQNGDLYHVPVQSTLSYVAQEQIKILDQVYLTLKIHEHCQAPLLQWEYVNTYWIAPESGFIWRSIQHMTPNLPAATVEVFKPAIMA